MSDHVFDSEYGKCTKCGISKRESVGTVSIPPVKCSVKSAQNYEDRITTEIPDHIWQVFHFLDNNLISRLPREWYEPIVVIRRETFRSHPDSRIDSFCKLECGEGMYIGKFCHIASHTHLGIGGGLLILEQGSSCASGVKIITGSNLPGSGHGCSAVDPDAIIKRSFVHVKRNATLYTNSVVCPGVTVGVGAVVLPGAVVTCDIPDGETWGGVPARKIAKKNGATGTVSIDGDLVSRESFDRACPKELFGSDPGRSFATDLQDPRTFPITVSSDYKADTELACPNCRKPVWVHNTLPRNDWLYVCPHCRIESKSKSFWWAGKQLEVDRTQVETLRSLVEYTDEGSDIRKRVAAVDGESKCDPSCGCGVSSQQSHDSFVDAQAEMYGWDDDKEPRNIG